MRRGPGLSAGVLVAVAAVATAGAVAIVLWARFPLGVDDWAWRRVAAPSWGRAVLPAVAFVLVGALVLAAWRRVERIGRLAEAGLVGAVVAVAFLAQVLVGQQGPAGYHESVFAVGLRGAAAYHTEARRIPDLAAHLRGYEREMRREFRGQISTHPAGPVVLFWCLNRVFAGHDAAAERFERWCERWLAKGMRLAESPAAAALFAGMTPAERAGVWLSTLALRLAACLVVVPVYVTARALHGRRAALMAGALAAAIPSVLLFSPTLDQCFPVLAASACWFGYAGGRRRSVWRAAVAGAFVSVGLFLTLAFAVVAFWGGLLGLVGLRHGEEPVRRRQALGLLAGGACGFLVPVAALYAAFGYNSLAVWWACWQGNATFNALYRRTYWKWVLVNPVEFVGFLGVPLACVLGRRVAGEVRALWRRNASGRDWPTLIVAGLLVALNVAGANLGEVARLWMFLMPACAVAAAGALEGYAPYRRAVFAVLFGMQCVQVVVFKGSLDVLLGLYRELGG